MGGLRPLLLGCMMAALGLLAAGAVSAKPKPKEQPAPAAVEAAIQPSHPKDELIIGISQFPANFHPSIESMMAKSYVLGLALRPLTAFDADWKLVCMLCETVPSLENGLARPEKTIDGRRGVALSFTLRADAKWADGTPVTTEDVLFSADFGRHPMSGVADGELYRRILKIEVKDKRSFVLHMDRLTFDYNVLNAFHILPAHLERKNFERPADYRTRSAYETETTNPGLYNGPYRITQVVQGSHVVLERNHYWTGKPSFFRRITIKSIENTAALEANVLSGGIDMIAGELGLPLEQAIAFEKRQGKRFQVLFKPGLVYEHLDVNLSSPILSDHRVRQALLYGLDRALMSRQLFEGRQAVAQSSVNPLDGVHSDDVTHYAFDPVRAGQLLDQAGWRMAGAVRRNATGEPLVLELATTAGNRSRELVAQVIQAQWKRLGIDLRLKFEAPRIFFGETVTKRAFPHLALFAWSSAPESVPRSTLHSSQIPSEKSNWSGQNYTGYANLAMDDLLDQIEIETDRGRRLALWRRLQQLYATDLPALPLFFRADSFILPQSLHGLVPTGHQDPSTLWVENWRWE